MSPGRKIASGHNLFARDDGIAENTPNRRASYDAAATTPRLPSPPTTTGLPTSSGRRSSSTATKNISISTCAMVREDSPVVVSTMCITIRQLRCCRAHLACSRTTTFSTSFYPCSSNCIRRNFDFGYRRCRNGLSLGGLAMFRFMRRSKWNWNVYWRTCRRNWNEHYRGARTSRNRRMARTRR